MDKWTDKQTAWTDKQADRHTVISNKKFPPFLITQLNSALLEEMNIKITKRVTKMFAPTIVA